MLCVNKVSWSGASRRHDEDTDYILYDEDIEVICL